MSTMKKARLYLFVFFLALSFVSCHEFNVYQRTENNYGEEVDSMASEYGLPAEYLKALIILECSGEKQAGTRFEPGNYRKLIELRDGKRRRFQGLSRSAVYGLSNAAIKNLATSWGPFQLMGYQCLRLGVFVKDIRGDEAVKWGVKWIHSTYGNYLKSGKYEEAFRIHNSGRPHGRTTDPNYVSNGLSHMKYFSEKTL